ncbi:hypothetical protein T492DRAFT_1039376 [Pavlovales sp. CCMP2436]|nr:hypothetical protein T492DRAFT_1039376 [Pavlovales sp. CCMP2436]
MQAPVILGTPVIVIASSTGLDGIVGDFLLPLIGVAGNALGPAWVVIGILGTATDDIAGAIGLKF